MDESGNLQEVIVVKSTWQIQSRQSIIPPTWTSMSYNQQKSVVTLQQAKPFRKSVGPCTYT